MGNWITIHNPTIYVLKNHSSLIKSTHRLREKNDRNQFTKQLEAKTKTGRAILTSDNIDFKLKLIRISQEGYDMPIEGINYPENITMAHVHGSNLETPNLIK